MPSAAAFARNTRAASGSDSTATNSARGKARPDANKKRPDPAPGSTTRCGVPSEEAHAIMDSTIGGGV